MAADFEALGQDLTARYALGPLLGKGGFGSVHRARDMAAGRDVAVKLLNASGGSAVDRFLREAAVAATLEHPNLIKVHAAGRHGGRPAIVFELIDGETFSAATRTLPPRARAELLRDAARGVGHAHARGAVHRDLKPDNLLVGRDGRVRVTDFGLVWHEGAEHLTRTGAILGTPSYMAPEQFDERVRARAEPTVDVWALGVILYEALCGAPPFAAQDLVALMAQIQQAPITPPRRIDPRVDRGLEAVCLRALERDPARRFADAEAFARALDDALDGRLPTSGRRGAWILAGATALAAVTAALWFARGREALPDASATSTPATSSDRAVHDGPPSDNASGLAITHRQLLQAAGPRWAAWADARRVVTGGPDDDLRLWDAATGEQLRSWARASVTGCRIGPGRVALGSDTGLHVLSVDGDEPPSSHGRLVSVTQVACAEQTGLLAVIGRTGDEEGVFLVSKDGRRTSAPLPDQGRAAVLALTDDGSRLAVGLLARDEGVAGASLLASAGPVSMFTIGDAVRRQKDVMLPGRAHSLRFVPGAAGLFTGTTGGQIAWVPRDAGAVMGAVERRRGESDVHDGPTRSLALTPAGDRLLSIGDHARGFELVVWAHPRHSVLGEPFVAPGRALTLEVSPDGRAAVIGTEGGGVHVRALDVAAASTLAPAADVPLTDRALLQASAPRWAVWADARRVVTGGEDDDVRLWDASTGAQLRAWSLRARTAVRQSDGRVALGSDAGLHVLAVDDAGPPAPLGRFQAVRRLAGGTRSGHLAVIGRASSAPGWSVSVVEPAGQHRVVPVPADRPPLGLAISSDGASVAVTLGQRSDDDELPVLEAACTIQQFTLRGAIARRGEALIPGLATAACFVPDGDELLASNQLGQVGFIPASAGEVMGEYHSPSSPGRAHTDGVAGLLVSDDGARLFTLGGGAQGSEVKVWDRPARTELVTLAPTPGRPHTLDLSSDGRALVIGTVDGGVHVRVVPGR